MKTKSRSLLIKIFAVIFVLSACFSGPPVPRAQAQFTDFANLIENIVSAIENTTATGATLVKLSWDTIGEHLLNAMAYNAGQQLLNQLTKSTIKWIQGGFHGSPSFAVDTKGIATSIADQIAGEMILSLRNVASCEFTVGYTDNLKNNVYYFAANRPYTYNQKAKCPFDPNLHFTAQQFYDDFSKGGWDSFGAALEDGGNPYRLQTITAEELAAKEGAATGAKKEELSWSNGFTSIKDTNDCNYPSDIFYYAGEANPDWAGFTYLNQGLSLYDAWSRANNTEYVPGDPSFPSDQALTDMAYLTKDQATALNETTFSDPARAKAMQDAYCKTTTPGKIVGDQLTKTLGIDMDRLGFADNMDKIVSALIDTLTQKTIRAVFGKGNSSSGGVGTGSGTGTGVGSSQAVAVTTNDPSYSNGIETINGEINSSDANNLMWFRWSDVNFTKESRAGNQAFLSQLPVLDTTGQKMYFWANLNNLKPGTIYYYNADAQTADGTILNGEVKNFKAQ